MRSDFSVGIEKLLCSSILLLLNTTYLVLSTPGIFSLHYCTDVLYEKTVDC